MTSPTLELQKAVHDRLLAFAPVTTLIDHRVYDHVPRAESKATPNFPYISFGPSEERTDDADCITGFEITMQLDAWSRAVGFVEARQVADAVRMALHDHEFNLTANGLVFFRHRLTRIFRDPDGLTSHAALTFEAFAEQS